MKRVRDVFKAIWRGTSVTKWMMFIDSDEFFFGTREDDLRVILTYVLDYGTWPDPIVSTQVFK